MKTIRLSPLLTGIILAGCSSYTFAQLGANLSVDLRALSMGNAVTADPPGVNAIHFNPAGLTKIQGLQTEQQIIVANFDIQREFSVPAGYNVFGYSDDPMVCHDGPEVSSDICTDFKGKVSGDVEYVSLFVPYLKKMVDLGEGLPLVAPTMGAAGDSQ